MPRLKVRELAEAQQRNISWLQRYSGVTMPSVRRYWYNTRDGKVGGPPIKEVNLDVLERIARALEVSVKDLIEDRHPRLRATAQHDTRNRAGSDRDAETVPTAQR